MLNSLPRLRFAPALFIAPLLTLLSACTQLPGTPAANTTATAPAALSYRAPLAAPVILVSIDGFRPDYLKRGVSPTLNALASQGVLADVMRPSFPSITFPNHYTLVTGLRPDRHGIVGNTMVDAAIPGVKFTLSNRDAVTDRRWWDQAEPVWVTAEKNGVRSATMFWPGSEAAIHGVRPSEWRMFDGKVTPDQRVDTLLGWLDKPAAERPSMLTLYFDDVDHAGHDDGPDSQMVTEAVAHVDRALARLMAGLKARQIEANLVIVSDHGMAATSAQRTIVLDQLVPASSFRMVNSGTYAAFEAVPGKEAELEAALLKPHAHMQCWKKAQIPARFEFGRNPRVPSYLCLAETGWLIFADQNPKNRSNGGAHGYDNLAPEMGALFIAHGPAFRPAARLQSLDNVDVYPLLMRLIQVPALASDGKPEVTQGILK